MNLVYTLRQRNHNALLMIDYYKQKIEIYMTQNAQNKYEYTANKKNGRIARFDFIDFLYVFAHR